MREWAGTDNTYGSRHYVAAAQQAGTLNGLKALVLLDMIGDRALTIRRESPKSRTSDRDSVRPEPQVAATGVELATAGPLGSDATVLDSNLLIPLQRLRAEPIPPPPHTRTPGELQWPP